jgi:hypothetical protein
MSNWSKWTSPFKSPYTRFKLHFCPGAPCHVGAVSRVGLPLADRLREAPTVRALCRMLWRIIADRLNLYYGKLCDGQCYSLRRYVKLFILLAEFFLAVAAPLRTSSRLIRRYCEGQSGSPIRWPPQDFHCSLVNRTCSCEYPVSKRHCRNTEFRCVPTEHSRIYCLLLGDIFLGKDGWQPRSQHQLHSYVSRPIWQTDAWLTVCPSSWDISH